MKKLKVIVSTSLLLTLITACGNNAEPDETNLPYEQALEETELLDEQALEEGGYTFQLTQEEIDIYEILKEELSTSVLKDVDLFSIAKIHIQASIDGEWETEYAMFSEVGRGKTLEEWGIFYKEEMSNVEHSHLVTRANADFSLIEKGTIVKDSENEAQILFQTIHGDDMAFRFIKNDNGIWEVRFHPIDYI